MSSRNGEFQFLVDSGCTNHFVKDESLVTITSNINQHANLAKDGESMKTSGIGKINMTTIVRGEKKHRSMNNVLVFLLHVRIYYL